MLKQKVFNNASKNRHNQYANNMHAYKQLVNGVYV